MKRLTPKQEKFAREYFRTGAPSEAYRLAYDAENMKPETVARCAATLLADPNITATLERLRKCAEQRTVMTKEQAIARLADIALQDEKDRVAALKQLGKIMGWEAPTRQQIEAAFTSPLERYLAHETIPEPEPE